MKTKAKPRKPAPEIPAAATQLLDARQAAHLLRVSIREFWRILAAGEYPPADIKIGRLPRWRVATHNSWINGKTDK